MFEIYWVYVLFFLLGVHEIYLFNRRFTKFGGKDFGFLKYKNQILQAFHLCDKNVHVFYCAIPDLQGAY